MLVAIGSVGPGACASSSRVSIMDPDHPVQSAVSLGVLETSLDEALPVRSVAAAAEAALRDRGYTVVSARTTDESARLEASPPGRSMSPRWRVDVRADGAGKTSIAVTRRPWADGAAARVLMDAILQRLNR
ncbi:MAG: hypothetical protein H6809_02900 [Phycisphaeraceae bacterium]|nr:hypothetical protein [Phycisphaeraceae bacterium]